MYPLALSLSSLFHHLRIPIQFFSLACVYFRLFKFTRHICTHTNTNTKRKGPVDANVLSGRTAKPDSVCLWRVGGSIYTSSLHRQFTQYTFGKKKICISLRLLHVRIYSQILYVCLSGRSSSSQLEHSDTNLALFRFFFYIFLLLFQSVIWISMRKIESRRMYRPLYIQ